MISVHYHWEIRKPSNGFNYSRDIALRQFLIRLRPVRNTQLKNITQIMDSYRPTRTLNIGRLLEVSRFQTSLLCPHM
jgi:hypothetical protein